MPKYRQLEGAMMLIVWSTAALITGFVLDLLLGDPRSLPHIVRWIGALIAGMERMLRRLFPKTERGEIAGGIVLVFVVALLCTALPLGLLVLCWMIHPVAAFVVESLLCWQRLAATSLKKESMRISRSLKNGDVSGAREQVAMIVGRDTANLDGAGINRATVETVAENTSDGVVAPLFFIMLGGAPLGCLYKAINTLDSMVGYKSATYLHFGRAAAKTDDVLNYLPSRLCALLMIVAAYLLRLEGKAARTIWRRDRRSHASPNSAQTEAVCAGALGIRLAGPAFYHGKPVAKPYIGDDKRPIDVEDIANANRLMLVASLLMLALACLLRVGLLGVTWYAGV